MADEGLIIKIAANAKEFVSGADKAVKDVKSKFQGLGNEIGKELQRVHTVGATAFKGVTGLLGAAATGAAALITKGVTYNQTLEQSIKSLEILLGSSEKAEAMMNELKEYDKISPFDLTQLAEAAKQMMAYGIETEKVIPMLKMFGDISMGDQDKVLSLALAFSQCSATGKLMGQDLNQMINAGFNPLEYIAKKTGKSVAELKEEMSKGAITVEMVEDAFRMATSEGERFYRATEKGSQTVQGRLSILEADFESFLGKIAEGFTKTFGDEILPMVEDYMSRISDAFSEGGFNGLIVELGKILGELVDVIVQKLPDLIDMGVEIVNAILKGILDNIFTIKSGAEQIIAKLLEGIRGIMPRILEIAKVIVGTIAEGFIEYQAMIMEMGIQIITTLAQGLADAAPTLAPRIVELVTMLIGMLVENMPALLEAAITIVANIANAIVEKLPELLGQITTLVYELGNKIFSTIGEWGPAVLKILAALIAAVLAAISALLISLFQNLGKWWDSSLKPWFDNLGNSIREKVTSIKTNVQQIVENIKTAVKTKVDDIKSDVQNKVNDIKTKVSEIVTNLKQSLTNKVNSIKESISNFLGNLKETVSEKVSDIVDNFTEYWQNLPEKMLDIGQNIVDGLWNGISNAWSWLQTKVEDLTSGLVGGLKNLLGISSPSKVFAEIGGYMTQGLAIGMEDETDMLQRTAMKQVNQLTGIYDDINLGMPQMGIAGKVNALSRIGQSVQSITNDNGNVFNFTNYFTGSGADAGDELFRQFQRRVRYSGGVL